MTREEQAVKGEGKMENLFELLNEEGVTVVASSKTGSTEVLQSNDGRLFLVSHLNSGRDIIDPVQSIPDNLTVRYTPPRVAKGLLYEFIPKKGFSHSCLAPSGAVGRD